MHGYSVVIPALLVERLHSAIELSEYLFQNQLIINIRAHGDTPAGSIDLYVCVSVNSTWSQLLYVLKQHSVSPHLYSSFKR